MNYKTTVRPRYSYDCCPFQDGGPGGTFYVVVTGGAVPVCEGHVFVLVKWRRACVISSLAIISLRKKELVASGRYSSWFIWCAC